MIEGIVQNINKYTSISKGRRSKNESTRQARILAISIFISHVNSLSSDARLVDGMDAEIVVDEAVGLGLGTNL